jgi:hypothetical protein
MLWAIDHPEAIADALRERDRYDKDITEFLKRTNSRWSN